MKTVRFLFNDEMARAIVQGRKTVTRRPVDFRQLPHGVIEDRKDFGPWPFWEDDAGEWHPETRQAATGDILIGRECWAHLAQDPEVKHNDALPYGGTVEYRADHDPPLSKPGGWHLAEPGDPDMVHWRPSIHMPDWAARIRRRVVSVTVERLQDIDHAGAVWEGFIALPGFIVTWDGIYGGKGLGWEANPWVWRIEFSAENIT